MANGPDFVQHSQSGEVRFEQLFPNCITETKVDGKVQYSIDAESLSKELSVDIVDTNAEKYQFTWPGKTEAKILASSPTTMCLRPITDGKGNFEDTQNVYIKGDNLTVLKILRETYYRKVKMIYIDPPYNTGNDSFLYNDDYSITEGDYRDISADYSNEGFILTPNPSSNGRLHTNWLNMMYPRLKLARDLLSEDGLIFISINDIEIANLTKICDEIFGSNNFVADLIWANKEGGGSSDSKLFRIKHEHILCYSRNVDNVKIIGIPITNADRYKGSDEYVSERGRYYLQKLGMGSIQYSPSLDYPIEAPDGSTIMPADNNGGKKACWRWSKEKYTRNKERGFIEIKKDSSGIWTVYTKQYMNCDNDGNIINRTQRPMGIIDEFSSTQSAKLMEKMGMGSFFDYTKPIELIKYLISRVECNNQIIMDFFSGSASTAHAVLDLNREDNGNRHFIMVQIPESCNKNSAAYKSGYNTICDIGIERIRRAGKALKTQSSQTTLDQSDYSLDTGFRIFYLDTTNMVDTYYTPENTDQQKLFDYVDNVKKDRRPEDLLIQSMLECSIPLSASIDNEPIDGRNVFVVNNGELVACFDHTISEKVIEYIAKTAKSYAIIRDASIDSDSTATNFEQIFKTYNPNVERKVI